MVYPYRKGTREDYTASLCLTFILLSKLVHLHFHYSYEDFTLQDPLYAPTFFAYDALVFLVLRAFLDCSARLRRVPARKGRSVGTTRCVLANTMFLAGASCSLFICFLTTVEFSVYVNIGGLCAWPTVLEVFSTPSYLLIFWEQWMTVKQTWFVCLVPVANAALTLCVNALLHAASSAFQRFSTRPNSNAIRLGTFAMASLLFKDHRRPWVSLALLGFTLTGWTIFISRTYHHINKIAQGSTLQQKLSSPTVRSTINSKLLSPPGWAIPLGLVTCLIPSRPPLFGDVSVTVPTSVIHSLIGQTSDRCPVGKPWPEVDRNHQMQWIRSLSAEDPLTFPSVNMSHYWPKDFTPPDGFEMFSHELLAQWADDHEAGIVRRESLSGYSALFDDTKISNLGSAVHPSLAHDLSNVRVRNVVLILMESTPSHFVPFGPKSPFYTRAETARQSHQSYDDIRNMTPIANKLFDTHGGRHEHAKGGMSVIGAESTCSYTLKSLMASHCGVYPLPMDFMREAVADAHLYQPCLPHILHTLNDMRGGSLGSSDTGRGKWRLMFGQPCDERWDRQMDIMQQVGFDLSEEVIVKSTLAHKDAPYPVSGTNRRAIKGEVFLPEDALTPYFRDFVRNVKQRGDRFFLSHLTCSTHFPWPLPLGWDMRRYTDDEELNSLLNAMANQDEWIGKLLQVLEEEGVMNETLVVMTGDHGISLSEGDLRQRLQPHNPHINNFQVPLLFHHPHLPALALKAKATSLNILPTILDLLVSADSGSVDTELQFLQDLLPSYEGQSLLRPLSYTIPSRDGSKALPSLNFAMPTPGRGHVIVSSPDPAVPWRLSMPVCHHGTLAATNLVEDPQEDNPVRTVSLARLVRDAERRWGPEAGHWFEQAEERAALWVREISRRWRINQRSPPGEMVIKYTV